MCRQYILAHKCNCRTIERRPCDHPRVGNCKFEIEEVEVSSEMYCQPCVVKLSQQELRSGTSAQLDPRDLKISQKFRIKYQDLIDTDEDAGFDERLTDSDFLWLQNIIISLEVSFLTETDLERLSQEQYEQGYVFFKLRRVFKTEMISRFEDMYGEQERAENLARGMPHLLTPIKCDVLKDGEKDCTLCHEIMGQQDGPVTTPCGHIFGNSCIQSYIEGTSVACQICSKLFTSKNFIFPPVEQTTISPHWVQILRSD